MAEEARISSGVLQHIHRQQIALTAAQNFRPQADRSIIQTEQWKQMAARRAA
jgi:hypothetical protein